MILKFLRDKIIYVFILFMGILLGHFSRSRPKVVTKVVTQTQIVYKEIEKKQQEQTEKKIVSVKQFYCPNGRVRLSSKTEEFMGSQTFSTVDIKSTAKTDSKEISVSNQQLNWLVSFQVPKDYQDFKNYQIGGGYRIFGNVDLTASTNLQLKQFYFGGQIHF